MLSAEREVKPTMSEKKIVTFSKVSGSTVSPNFSASATDLKFKEINVLIIRIQNLPRVTDVGQYVPSLFLEDYPRVKRNGYRLKASLAHTVPNPDNQFVIPP